MPNTSQAHIELAQPEPWDIDLAAASAWINSVADERIAADNARFEEVLRHQQEVYEPLVENARQAGLVPEMPLVQPLIDMQQNELSERLTELERIDPGDEYGVLPQPLPVSTQAIISRAPFSQAATDRKMNSQSKVTAMASNGTIWMHVDSSFSGNWDWTSAAIGERMTKKSQRWTMEPTCVFSGMWGGFESVPVFFVAASVEVDIYVFSYNLTTQQSWVKRKTVLRQDGPILPGMMSVLNMPETHVVTGYGNASPGDKVFILPKVIFRGKAPFGTMKGFLVGKLDSITVL